MTPGSELLQAGTDVRRRRERLRELAAPWHSFRFPNPWVVSTAFFLFHFATLLAPAHLRGAFAVVACVLWAGAAICYWVRRERLWRQLILDESPELARKLLEERG